MIFMKIYFKEIFKDTQFDI